MSKPDTGTTPPVVVEPSAATPPQEPQAPAAATPEPPKPTEPPAKSGNVWDDPSAAEAEIKRLRQENGAARTNAKAQAAEDAKKELAQTIGKALGLVKDEPIDPTALTEQLTKSQADAKQARVELAVFRAASSAGGDPIALLDSTSFLRSLDNADPSDAEAVKAAIAAAVQANPRLGAAPNEPRVPAPNPGQGASGGGPSIDQQIAEATKKGDHARAIALKRQKYAAQT
ncbi:MAG: hypothetical protein QM714_02725 [Nocardioides sp.]|uniref:hypothetical protein n=1 Tax=Nocardioides sp. TaxID=35761 RepID=UPI0039E6DF85